MERLLTKTTEALKLEHSPQSLFWHEQLLVRALNWDHMVPLKVNEKP